MTITDIYSHPRIHRQYYPTSSRSSPGSIGVAKAFPLPCDLIPQTRRRGSLHCEEDKSHVDVDALSAKLNALALDHATYTRSRENGSPERVMIYARGVDGRNRSGSHSSSTGSSGGLARSSVSPRKMTIPSPSGLHHYPPRSPLASRQPRLWRISVVGPTPPDSPSNSSTCMHSTRYAGSPTTAGFRGAHTSSSPLFSPTCAIANSDSARSTPSPPASPALYNLAPLSRFDPFAKRTRSDSMSSVIAAQVPTKETATGKNKKLKRRWTISGSITKRKTDIYSSYC